LITRRARKDETETWGTRRNLTSERKAELGDVSLD